MFKRLTPAGLVAAGLLFAVSTPANADLIYESATLGPIGQGGGFSLSTSQYLGSRFTLDSPMTVTDVGGHMLQFSGDSLYAAIVQLSGLVPTGSPYDVGEVLASTTFTANNPSDDFRTPLNVALPAGDYALIFGAGLFGSTNGFGAMPGNNVDTPEGIGSYFFWNGSIWNNGGFSGARFVVEGVVPTPGAAALLGLGLLGLGRRRRR